MKTLSANCIIFNPRSALNFCMTAKPLDDPNTAFLFYEISVQGRTLTS